jgi:hypothetical protein
MPHEAHQIIEDVLAGLPLRFRLAHLAASALVEDGALSVEFLIELAIDGEALTGQSARGRDLALKRICGRLGLREMELAPTW